MNGIRAFSARRRTARFLKACIHVGKDPVLDGKPTVLTTRVGRIEIGDRFQLSSNPVPSHLVAWGVLRIGNDVSIGHGSAIAASLSVSIGDRTRIGPFLVLMDTDFHGERAKVGARPTTNTAVGPDSGYAPVRIGADVRIGAHVTVLRGATIGDGAKIAPGSVVNGTILPGAVAGGVPARVLDDRGEVQAESAHDTDVVGVLTRVFGLSTPPDLRTGPDEIPQWDSLGSLRLLLALEEALGIVLDEATFTRVRTVGELQLAVEDAKLRAPTT